MNNEMILNRREQKINSILNATATAFNNSLRRVSSYYGQVLEREINNRQTLALLNAQIAFIMAVFPIPGAPMRKIGRCFSKGIT